MPFSLPPSTTKRFGHVVHEDVDLLFLGVLQLPGRRLEELAPAARHDLHVLAAQAARRPAAVHGRVADADDQDALADLVDVAERHPGQPVDADVDAVARLVPSGKVQLLAARRAGADEHGVERGLAVEQALEAHHRRAVTNLDATIEDHRDLLVQHLARQAERRHVRAHQPARLGVTLEDHDLVAQRREIVRHRQRGRPGADAGDAFPVLFRGNRGKEAADIVAQVGRDTLQPADRDRLLIDARPPACRLAGAIAGASEDSRKHVAVAVQQIRFGVLPLGDQPDVLRHIRVGRTGPLTIDHLVEVTRVFDVRRLHPWGLQVDAHSRPNPPVAPRKDAENGGSAPCRAPRLAPPTGGR